MPNVCMYVCMYVKHSETGILAFNPSQRSSGQRVPALNQCLWSRTLTGESRLHV